MSELRILLLGTPQILWNDDEITIKRRLPRNILYYLAAHEAQLGRNHLLTLFWPEENEANARAYLRDNLSKLRASLPDPTLLKTSSTSVSLDRTRVTCDVLDFQKTIEQAGREPWNIPSDRPLPESSYRDLASAAKLWRSSQFIANVTLPDNLVYEEWVMTTGTRIQNLVERVAGRLADHCQVVNDYEDFMKWMHILVEIDPYNDDYHLKVMDMNVSIGNLDEALKYGISVRTRFQNGLSESISPEFEEYIKKLERRITKQSFGMLSSTMEQEVDQPFIGQNALIRNLEKKFQEGGVVFLKGDTGSGKSRIVAELCAQINPEPGLLKCECVPQQQNIPYQPLACMLRTNFSSTSFDNLTEVGKANLQKIAPEISINYSIEDPDRLSPSIDSQGAILEAFRALFADVACKKRMVFLLDDAHWCDESTLAVLSYMVENKVFPKCGLLLVTSDPAIRNQALSKFQAYILNQFSWVATTFFVPPLDVSSIHLLARNVLNQSLTKDMAEQVRQYSGGNPLFIKEILRSQSQYLLNRSTTDGQVIFGSSPVIQTIINLKLDNLTPVTKSIIYTAAVLGVNIDQELLEKACFHSTEEIVDAIEELEAARIIQMERKTDGILSRYAFTQNAFREGIINSLSASRKRLIHKRVAHALAEHTSGLFDKSSATLAEHYEAGGELENAFISWVDAGNYAKRMQSIEEEIRAFEHAEKLLIYTEMLLTDAQILKLFEPWISILYMNHDITGLTQKSRRLFSLGKQRGSSLLTGYALLGLSDTGFSTNNYEEAIRYVDEAMVYFADSRSIPYQVQGLSRRGAALYMTNRFNQALDAFNQALALTSDESPEFIHARGHLNHQIAVIHTFMGKPKLGTFYIDKAINHYIQGNNLHGQVDCYSLKILSLYYHGQYELALKQSEYSLAIARTLKYWRMIGYTLVFTGYSLTMLGRLDEAWKCAEEAIQIAGIYDHPELESAVSRLYGDIFRYLMDFEAAAEYYRKGWECNTENFVGLDNLGRLGHVLCKSGKNEEGIANIHQAYHSAKEIGLGTVINATQLYEIEINYQGMPIEITLDKLGKVIRDCKDQSIVSQWMVAYGLEAFLKNLQGDTDSAIISLNEIIQNANEISDPWSEISGRLAILKISKKTIMDNMVHVKRIRELMDLLGSCIKTPELQESFSKYATIIDNSLT